MKKSSHKKISLLHLWIAIRPKTLVASLIPVFLTACFSWEQHCFSKTIFLQCLLIVLGLQIGTNLVNDYYDYRKGADGKDRIGPFRVTQKQWLSSQILFSMIVFFFGISLFVSLFLGKSLFFLVCFFVFLGCIYTAGPFPLAYNGLGDLFAFIFFGPVVVAGQFYLYSHRYDIQALFMGMGVGFFSMALISVNNFRDRKTDAKVGKKTLSVFCGERFSRWQYTLCLLLAHSIFLFFFLKNKKILAFLGFLMLFLCSFSAIKNIWTVSSGSSVSSCFNRILSQTVLLFFLYGFSFSVFLLL